MIINEEPDQYVFYQENRFRILSGMARKCKEEENTSGDNFLLKKLNCGKMVAAIADGCGSGKRAFAESRMVIELMENCMKPGLLIFLKREEIMLLPCLINCYLKMILQMNCRRHL